MRELSLEELAKVYITLNEDANYQNALNNSDLYRKIQIEKLQKSKEAILQSETEEKRNCR